MLKVELHAHTADDPVDRIPYSTRDLIDRAVALGYDALAVTLHDKQLDLRPLEGYAAERGLLLIAGIERTIAGRHVLLLNFDRGAEDVRSFDDLARLRTQRPGLVVAPHPFFPGRTSVGAHLMARPELFDAVEYNAMFTTTVNFNTRAQVWAGAHGKPMVGNGDVHRFEQLGSTYSLVDAARHPDAICAAIASGAVQVVRQPLPWSSVIRVIGGLLLQDTTRLPNALRAFAPGSAAAE